MHKAGTKTDVNNYLSCVDNFRKDCTRLTNGASKGTKQALFKPVCVPKTAQYTDMSIERYRPMV